MEEWVRNRFVPDLVEIGLPRRVEACMDAETLDRWIDNVFGAKAAAEVLT